jgi:hypothetical protein
MGKSDRIRVIFHGGIVMLAGLLCGLPTVAEGDAERFWRTAHESLILTGTLMLAVSSVLAVLVLPKRESSGLLWSLLATGYGFTVGLVLQAVTGQHAFGPSADPILLIAFIGNTAGILGSVLTASLTIMGARAAYRLATPSILPLESR